MQHVFGFVPNIFQARNTLNRLLRALGVLLSRALQQSTPAIFSRFHRAFTCSFIILLPRWESNLGSRFDSGPVPSFPFYPIPNDRLH